MNETVTRIILDVVLSLFSGGRKKRGLRQGPYADRPTDWKFLGWLFVAALLIVAGVTYFAYRTAGK
jgi:hypothetical protein